jgi:hypothetical protein
MVPSVFLRKEKRVITKPDDFRLRPPRVNPLHIHTRQKKMDTVFGISYDGGGACIWLVYLCGIAWSDPAGFFFHTPNKVHVHGWPILLLTCMHAVVYCTSSLRALC